MNVGYQESIANCFLAALLAVLLQTPSPHWFGIALSPLLPWSHVSQATRIRIGEEGKKRERGGRIEERGGRQEDRGGRQEERGGRQEERGGRIEGRGGRQEERGGRQEESGGRQEEYHEWYPRKIINNRMKTSGNIILTT